MTGTVLKERRVKGSDVITVFLCGDVMTGRFEPDFEGAERILKDLGP